MAKRVSFTHIFVREYARSIGGESSVPCDPSGDIGSPLGLSDAVLLHDPATGEFLAAQDIFTGARAPVVVPTARAAAKGSKGGGARSRSGSMCASDGEAGGAPGATASSGGGGGGSSGGAAASACSVGAVLEAPADLRPLRPGEYYAGSIVARAEWKEAAVAAAAAEAAAAAAEARSGKGRKRKAPMSSRIPAPALSPNGIATPVPARARVALLSRSVLLLPEGTDLAAHTSAVNAEVASIHRSRSESTPGCPCSPLVPEDLERFSPSSLKAEALQRGLPAAGGKKALIQRICEHSMQNLGCCQAAVDALEAGEGEGEGEEGSSTSAEEAKWAATLAQDTRLQRVHAAALKLHESVCRSWAEGGGGGAGSASGAAAAPAAAAAQPVCPSNASGEGCHRDSGCMPSYCCNGPEGGARDPAQDEHYLRQFRSLILALVTHHGGAQLFFEEEEVHEWRQRMVIFLQGYLRECAEEEVDLEELEELALDPKVLASELGDMTEGAAAAAAAEARSLAAGGAEARAGAAAGGGAGAGEEGSFEALCRETLLKAMMAEAEAEAEAEA